MNRSSLLRADSPVQFCRQLLRIEGFGDMSVHAGGQGFPHVLLIGVGAHGNDRQPLRIFGAKAADLLRCLIAVHDRHLDIHQHRVVAARRRILDLVDGDLAVLGIVDLKAGFLEYRGRDHAVHLVVLGKQQPFAREIVRGAFAVCILRLGLAERL